MLLVRILLNSIINHNNCIPYIRGSDEETTFNLSIVANCNCFLICNKDAFWLLFLDLFDILVVLC